MDYTLLALVVGTLLLAFLARSSFFGRTAKPKAAAAKLAAAAATPPPTPTRGSNGDGGGAKAKKGGAPSSARTTPPAKPAKPAAVAPAADKPAPAPVAAPAPAPVAAKDPAPVPEKEFHVCVLGGPGVGKTSLVSRLAGKPFARKTGHVPTVGSEAKCTSLLCTTSAGLLAFHLYDLAWSEARCARAGVLRTRLESRAACAFLRARQLPE